MFAPSHAQERKRRAVNARAPRERKRRRLLARDYGARLATLAKRSAPLVRAHCLQGLRDVREIALRLLYHWQGEEYESGNCYGVFHRVSLSVNVQNSRRL